MRPNKKFLKNVINETLVYDDLPITLVGSFNNPFLKYFGDIDVNTFLSTKDLEKGYKHSYDAISSILAKIEKDEYTYFLEMKIETEKEKYKIFDIGRFTSDKFKILFDELKFVKIDIAIWEPYAHMFIECESLYIYKNVKNKIKRLYEDIEELKREREYYKILKRRFSIAKMKKDKDVGIKLTDFFNSDVGLIMMRLKNRDIMKKVEKKYDDDITKKRIAMNKMLLEGDFGKVGKNYVNRVSESLLKSL